ncbi:MAG: hypothetical protein DSY37_01200 [Hyperthermus sp.]|nr:MAG: hypothetical protein DSY37_01200 [Hyperthermus sp.]
MQHVAPAGRCEDKYRWVDDLEVAVAPVPSSPEVIGCFRGFTVVALSHPLEYVVNRGIDPRMLEFSARQVVWFPVGKYNAPSLAALAKNVERVWEDTPLLAQSLRGCGRAVLLAVAVILRRRKEPLPPLLSRILNANGCGIETLPQLMVLEAYSAAVRSPSLLHTILGSSSDNPVPEYTIQLALKLAWLVDADPIGEALAGLRGGVLKSIAEILAERFGYSISWIEVHGSRKRGVRVRLIAWIPRFIHPAASKKGSWGSPVKGMREVEELVASYVDVGSELVEVVVEVKKPEEVPFLSH